MIDDILRRLPDREDFQNLETEDLIKILKNLGINYNKNEFEPLLRKYRFSTEDLIDIEFEEVIEDFDDKKYFTVLYCIMELRKRHFPTMANMDWLEDLMQEGYEEIYENIEKGIEKWISAWELVKDLIPSNITAIEDADSLTNILTQSICTWCQEFGMELANAAIDNKKYHHEMIRYTKEFISKFPESDSIILLNMKAARADSLFSLGKYRELNELFKEMYEEFPDEVWMYLRISSIFVFLAQKAGKSEYFDKAESLMKKASKVQNMSKYDRGGIKEHFDWLAEVRTD